MIETKTELAIAAHDFAVETLNINDSHEIEKKRHDAFEKLGIEGKHFADFTSEAQSVRTRYLGLRLHKLTDDDKGKK